MTARHLVGPSSGYWATNFALFVAHVGVWTLLTLLIASSKGDNDDFAYDKFTVILLVEITKLALAICFHFWSVPPEDWFPEAQKIIGEYRVGIYYAFPAVIYALYNFLFFLNLTFFDPVSYRVLINMRILWSGLLFQIFFGESLGTKKWFALVLLMLGCAINQLSSDFQLETRMIYLLAVATQAFTSSLGGVYNEYLLKKNVTMGINQKNMYLYFFSILVNLLFITLFKPELLDSRTFFKGYDTTVYMIIICSAFAGFSTALFLQYLNILLKEYAHSGEMFLTAILQWMIFGKAITAKIAASVILVVISVYLWNKKKEHVHETARTDVEQGADRRV